MFAKFSKAIRWGFILSLAAVPFGAARGQGTFINYETPPVHPIDMSPDGSLLAALNLPAGQLEIYGLSQGVPIRQFAVPVGMDPTSARFRNDAEVWVTNHISDSVSVVNLATREVKVVRTLDEPSDVVFAGSPVRAFVSCAQVNTIQIFDPETLQPAGEVLVKGEEPRSLAVSVDGSKVYVAIFESGNGTTILSGGAGNGTIASPPNVVNDPLGPYGGVNPPPNGPGGTFNPPKRAGNPAPPGVGLIVRLDGGGKWRDDNASDWTDFVSGPLARNSGRIPGWSLLDNDLAIIDAATLAVNYAHGIANICMSASVNPANGRVYVVGTEARNEIRFEPNVKGVFLRVNVGICDNAGITHGVVDLNPHLDYLSRTIDQAERDKSIGDPRGIAWTADGTRGFITGMGSNNLIVIDADGNRLATAPVDLPEGPTGIAVDEARGRLYVFSRFASQIATLRLSDLKPLAKVDMFNPSPSAIRVGRKHLYDTHKNSGLGQISCGSCHIDGKMDRLAWDLGDPAGAMKSIHSISMDSPQTGALAGTHNNLGGVGELLNQPFTTVPTLRA